MPGVIEGFARETRALGNPACQLFYRFEKRVPIGGEEKAEGFEIEGWKCRPRSGDAPSLAHFKLCINVCQGYEGRGIGLPPTTVAE